MDLVEPLVSVMVTLNVAYSQYLILKWIWYIVVWNGAKGSIYPNPTSGDRGMVVVVICYCLHVNNLPSTTLYLLFLELSVITYNHSQFVFQT